ncbi:tyrosine-type recombinase/integrase [Actinomadura sp. 7K507]|uniref:tyrosine-type recombinase/integrase n=1 Tax=Actinomadura sp. 7K507 TaxID=2530365 RepID=UPI0010463DE1|nr:tyrosine-type recombinase/integrase [Actinomadura sp. 7K507]TDC86498.1 site-specific integrase [Actinomadura sp. 7K507]
MAWVEKRGPWFRVRYRDADGTVHTSPDKHPSRTAATEAAEEMETDVRRGQFIDPNTARTNLAEWAQTWRHSHPVAPSTRAKYDHYLDAHIVPAFGDVGLDAIRRMAVKQWAQELSARYAPSTVSGIVTLLSIVLTEAVEERMIAHNPIQGLRLGHLAFHHDRAGKSRPVPTAEQVGRICERVRQRGGRNMEIMVITAAWTGMRWGELAGLARGNCRTSDGYIQIDPEVGALHEVGAQLWLGPPKSPAAARRIDLPPFLTELLEEAMSGHDHDQVFVAPQGGWLRRSHFARRIWRPVCDGAPGPSGEDPPILTGTVFHGLRHHHKTVLDELDLPEVIKHERMGHKMKGIQGVYSHVTDAMRKRVVTRLQRRWRG